MGSISIHALRVEGDFGDAGRIYFVFQFQSTPSVWRATLLVVGIIYGFIISIHALRVEGDEKRAQKWTEGIISIHALRVEGDNS